jgi:hypothetical protein
VVKCVLRLAAQIGVLGEGGAGKRAQRIVDARLEAEEEHDAAADIEPVEVIIGEVPPRLDAVAAKRGLAFDRAARRRREAQRSIIAIEGQIATLAARAPRQTIAFAQAGPSPHREPLAIAPVVAAGTEADALPLRFDVLGGALRAPLTRAPAFHGVARQGAHVLRELEAGDGIVGQDTGGANGRRVRIMRVVRLRCRRALERAQAGHGDWSGIERRIAQGETPRPEDRHDEKDALELVHRGACYTGLPRPATDARKVKAA